MIQPDNGSLQCTLRLYLTQKIFHPTLFCKKNIIKYNIFFLLIKDVIHIFLFLNPEWNSSPITAAPAQRSDIRGHHICYAERAFPAWGPSAGFVQLFLFRNHPEQIRGRSLCSPSPLPVFRHCARTMVGVFHGADNTQRRNPCTGQQTAVPERPACSCMPT